MKILKLNIDGGKNKMKIREFLLWKLENFKTLTLLSVSTTSQDGEKLWKVFIIFHHQKHDLTLISPLFYCFHFRINGPQFRVQFKVQFSSMFTSIQIAGFSHENLL